MNLPPKIHVIAVSFEKFGQLKVFVQSWLNQNRDNWELTVIHDGPNPEFDRIMASFQAEAPERIRFQHTPTRFNDWGHSLREIGLRDAGGDYVLITNADNYFIPRAVEFMNSAIAEFKTDIVLFDMVHSHEGVGGRPVPAYSYLQTQYARNQIDISSAIVRTWLAKAAGFRDKTFAGDATYFEDVARVKAPAPISIAKITRVMLVHN